MGSPPQPQPTHYAPPPQYMISHDAQMQSIIGMCIIILLIKLNYYFIYASSSISNLLRFVVRYVI